MAKESWKTQHFAFKSWKSSIYNIIQYLRGRGDLGNHHTYRLGVFLKRPQLCASHTYELRWVRNRPLYLNVIWHITKFMVDFTFVGCFFWLACTIIAGYLHTFVRSQQFIPLWLEAAVHRRPWRACAGAMARAGLLPHEKKLLETKDLVEAIGCDPSVCTLPETNGSPLKMLGSNRNFLL